MFKTRAKFAGVRPPVFAPKFEIARKPLWKPNNRVSGAANPEADPIFGTNASQNTIYHYQTDGNAYLRQTWDDEMAWQPHATTPANADVFAFKCLIKPHEIHGRRLIYSTKGDGVKSGGIFVDMVDGKVRVGWYDTVQKREVYTESNVPMFEPGHWHYLYVRKRYPDTTLSNCWTDTILSQTASAMNDVLLVRRFRKEAASVHLQRPWDYKPNASVRNFVGLTSDKLWSVSGAGGTGLVSRADRTFTGNAAGQVTASATLMSEDMVGMLFCPGGALPAHPFAGQTFTVSSVSSGTVFNVVDRVTGAAPDLSALVADPGGIYLGAKLIESEGFTTSESVDQTSYDIELFGSHLAADPESGVLPFVGEFASFAYTVESGATPNIFETTGSDYADAGTDVFGNVEIYAASATEVGEIKSNEAAIDAFTAVDTEPYAGAASASSAPNEPLEIAVNASASSARAKPLVWKFVDPIVNVSKSRRVRCAFYDPEQGQVSAPGPELVVNPGGDDQTNPSGSVTILLTDLPVSTDSGPIETWIYVTPPGSFTYFKAAEVPSGTAAIALSKSERELGRGAPLEFDNWPPPECSQLEVSQGSLVCGNLRRWVNSDEGVPADFPDVAVFSKPNRPTAFPADNLIGVPDASRAGITGLRDFNGRLIITKRDTMHRAALRQGAPVTEVVSKKIGCASGATLVELEGTVLFWGKRGIYAYDGSGVPRWVGMNVESLFSDGGLEPGYALRAVAAMNPQRNQVVVTLREAGALYTSHRLSIEPDQRGGALRYSRYESPNVTALADHSTEKAEVGVLVGGTEEGFFVWLDRGDTNNALIGATAAVYGSPTLVAASGATSTVVPVTGTLDLALAGARGAVLSWGTQRAIVLFAESGALHLDRPASALPASGDALALGAVSRYWETRWLDMDDMEFKKRARYLDVLTTLGSALVTVTAYKDYGATPFTVIPYTVGTPPPSQIDTSAKAVKRFDIGHLNANHLKFRFESTTPFEIVELVLRVSDADNA